MDKFWEIIEKPFHLIGEAFESIDFDNIGANCIACGVVIGPILSFIIYTTSASKVTILGLILSVPTGILLGGICGFIVGSLIIYFIWGFFTMLVILLISGIFYLISGIVQFLNNIILYTN